jgi:hypothetical protein
MKDVFTDWRILLLGVLSWLIPFLTAFAFFTASGELVIPQPLFKSLMVVVGAGVGVPMLVAAFRRIRPALSSGFAIGAYWLAINWALDLLVLLPMSSMSAGEWFADIGLRYLVLPMIATGIGAVAGRSR